MIQKYIKTALPLVCIITVVSSNCFAQYKLQATSGIYDDLRNDANAIKMVDAWLRMYQLGDNPSQQEGDREAFVWLANQERMNASKVSQIGIEIVKREKDLNCKSFLISEVSDIQNIDKQPLVEEIHNQLQQLPRKENGDIRRDGFDFIHTSAIVLSRIGTESDKQILLALSRDCPDDIQIKVANEIKKLDERLARERTNPRAPKGRGEPAGPSSSSGRPENGDPQTGGTDPSFSSRWPWILGGGLVLLGGILLLARRMMTHPNRK